MIRRLAPRLAWPLPVKRRDRSLRTKTLRYAKRHGMRGGVQSGASRGRALGVSIGPRTGRTGIFIATLQSSARRPSIPWRAVNEDGARSAAYVAVAERSSSLAGVPLSSSTEAAYDAGTLPHHSNSVSFIATAWTPKARVCACGIWITYARDVMRVVRSHARGKYQVEPRTPRHARPWKARDRNEEVDVVVTDR